jgi:hypothetical protein
VDKSDVDRVQAVLEVLKVVALPAIGIGLEQDVRALEIGIAG